MLIDSHCHLFLNQQTEAKIQIEEAKKSGIHTLINVSVSGSDNFNVCKKLCNDINFRDIFFTLGLHPSEIENYSESDLEFIEKNINKKGIVAIGEIGLDYYRDSSKKTEQKDLFISQLEIARKVKKPVIIHNRSGFTTLGSTTLARDDVLEILNHFKGVCGVFHCFSGDVEFAKKILDFGFYISFAGNITYKKAFDLVEVAKMLPDDKIIIETDSPYLAPVPKRGKINTPSNLSYIAAFIAELRNSDFKEFSKLTRKNTERLFGI